MNCRSLIQGFKLFSTTEVPLRLEFQVAGDESWRSVFRDDRLELINLFLDPEGILRLAVNNLMFEFLERADDADALARLTRFVWLRAVTSHSRFRFRILQIAPENRSLFVSQWLQEFQA